MANVTEDLLKAASQGNAAGVRSALKRGARVGSTDQLGRTALHLAASNGRIEVMGILLDAKASLTPKDSDGLTPLLRAARSLQGEAVELLLNRGASRSSLVSFLGARDSAGRTLLHTAAGKGTASSVRVFLSQGIDADPRDGAGRTPLSLAAEAAGVESVATRKQYLDTVYALLEKGADPLRPDNKGYTPLWYAVHKDDGELSLLLAEKGVDAAALAEAYERGDRKIAEHLVEKIGDVKAVDAEGRTFLHVAVGGGNAALVRRLLTLQADVNAADRYGRTPLSLAVSRGDAEMTQILLEGGADPNKPGEGGTLPLSLAARLAKVDAATLLIEAGAEVNPRSGTTPLIAAVQARNSAVAELLISRGADVNAADADGYAPLHYAVETRTGISGMALMRILLDQGAEVDARNEAGQSPLMLAAAGGKREEAALLLERGANPDLPDAKGRTPLSAAKASGNAAMIRLLSPQN